MKKWILSTSFLLAALTILSSSRPSPGGEGFEIYVNGKVVLQRFGSDMNKPHTLRFASGTENDEISIRYYHCGKTGKNRLLTVKDEQDKVLREIRFSDAENAASGMKCRVSDIINLKRGNNRSLKLYYSSSELPEGRLLVSIVSSGTTVTGTP